jgi:hypothetical protein
MAYSQTMANLLLAQALGEHLQDFHLAERRHAFARRVCNPGGPDGVGFLRFGPEVGHFGLGCVT